MNKLAFFSSMTPAERGALLGSLLGAGGASTAAYLYTDNKDKKIRNAALAALAGGALGGGAGYGLLRQPSLQLEELNKNKQESEKLQEAMKAYNEQTAKLMTQLNRIGNAQSSIGQNLERAEAIGTAPKQPK